MHFELWVTEWLIDWSPTLSVKHEEESCVCTAGCISAVSCRRQSPLTESDFEWTLMMIEWIWLNEPRMKWMNPEWRMNEWTWIWMNATYLYLTEFGCAVVSSYKHRRWSSPKSTWVDLCPLFAYHPMHMMNCCWYFVCYLSLISYPLHNTTASAPSWPFWIRSVFYYVIYFHFIRYLRWILFLFDKAFPQWALNGIRSQNECL